MMAIDAYAAGFFDGEGCIVVSVSRGRGQVWTSLIVSVTQLAREPLDFLATNYGGSVVRGKAVGDWRKRSTVMFRWRVHNKEAVEFLQKIRPFLILKADEADVAMEYPHGDGLWKGAWNPMPQWAKEKRFEIRVRLKEIRDRRKVESEVAMKALDEERRSGP